MFSFMKTVPDRDSGNSSSFSRLPDKIVLHILSKIIDLKTLCLCKPVSKRFYQTVHQVDIISFTALAVNHSSSDSNTLDPRPPKNLFWFFMNDIVFKPFKLLRSMFLTPIEFPESRAPTTTTIPNFAEARRRPLMYYADNGFYESELYLSVIKSLKSFTRLKSLCINLPHSLKDVDSHCYLFKWKVNFGNKIDSYVFLSPNSICDKKGVDVDENILEEEEEEEEDEDEYLESHLRKLLIAKRYLGEAIMRHLLLLESTNWDDFSFLEKVSITDLGKRGRISVIGEGSPLETNRVRLRKWRIIDRASVSLCYIPLLEMPVTGYVMKGVTLVLAEMNDPVDDNYNSFMNNIIDWGDFEDREEAAYSEAVMEIFKKHVGLIERLH
ncbi:F-box domain containing protein [Tanacetum coccineum]